MAPSSDPSFAPSDPTYSLISSPTVAPSARAGSDSSSAGRIVSLQVVTSCLGSAGALILAALIYFFFFRKGLRAKTLSRQKNQIISDDMISKMTKDLENQFDFDLFGGKVRPSEPPLLDFDSAPSFTNKLSTTKDKDNDVFNVVLSEDQHDAKRSSKARSKKKMANIIRRTIIHKQNPKTFFKAALNKMSTIKASQIADLLTINSKPASVNMGSLRMWTDDFNPNDIVSRSRSGAFGTVYKGLISTIDGETYVSIKQLNLDNALDLSSVNTSIKREIELFEHLMGCPNIARLIGFHLQDSKDPASRASLVYEYMASGDLATFLAKKVCPTFIVFNISFLLYL